MREWPNRPVAVMSWDRTFMKRRRLCFFSSLSDAAKGTVGKKVSPVQQQMSHRSVKLGDFAMSRYKVVEQLRAV